MSPRLVSSAQTAVAPEAGFRTEATNHESQDNTGKAGRQLQATAWFFRYNQIPLAGLRAITDKKYSSTSAIFLSHQREAEEVSKRWQNAMISVEEQGNKVDYNQQPRDKLFFTRLVSATPCSDSLLSNVTR